MEACKDNVSFHTVSFMSKIAKTLRPVDELTLSEWANRYMILPKGDSHAGRYNTRNAPYQKEILDSITDPRVVDVTVMSSAQVGKSLIMKIGIGYYIQHEPSTQLIVLPTVELGERFSKTSLTPMLDDVKIVGDRVAENKSRNSSNTITAKSYAGGDLIIAGANSPRTLAQVPRRIVWMDEVDGFPGSAGEEGNPVLLAKKRTTSYWNKKHIMTSTPGVKGKSKIEDSFESGTMEEWSVKCPECGEFQEYDFKRVVFDSVSMTCKHCGCVVPERSWKKSEHKWIAAHPKRKKHRSFHLNQLASPMSTWSDIIEEYKNAIEKLKKLHDPNDLKVFINTTLGQTWDETEVEDDGVDENVLEARAELYDAELPKGVIILTAAIDVQKDRFEIEFKGWGRDYQNWGIYKSEIYGDLKMNEVWEQLETYLMQEFTFQSGKTLCIAGFAIDTGGMYTNRTYKWLKYMKVKYKGKCMCYGVKGFANKENIPLIHKKTAVNIKEQRGDKEIIIDNTSIYILGVNAGKEDISNWLKITEPGEGYCHFPKEANEGRGYTREYYEGLTSEKMVERRVGGVFKKTWVQKSGVRNEPLDLFNYNYAVLELIKPDWDTLERKLEAGINYMQTSRKRKTIKRSMNVGIEV